MTVMKTVTIMIALVTMADNESGHFLRGFERLALIRSQARIRAAKCYNQRADSRPFCTTTTCILFRACCLLSGQYKRSKDFPPRVWKVLGPTDRQESQGLESEIAPKLLF